MTAYELADWLDNFSSVNDDDGKIMSEISEKLRGQQSRLVKAQELVREYTALCMRQQAEINALSEVMDEQNCMNRKPRKTNTGVPNVSYSKHNNKYRVSVTAKNQTGFFGWFDDLELAELVAIEMRSKLHGEFANHGTGATS